MQKKGHKAKDCSNSPSPSKSLQIHDTRSINYVNVECESMLDNNSVEPECITSKDDIYEKILLLYQEIVTEDLTPQKISQ
jgi:hypothetical protein